MERVSVKIGGMSCGHCARAVQRALAGVAGVELERVEIGSAVVRYDQALADVEQIARAIEEEGYSVLEARTP